MSIVMQNDDWSDQCLQIEYCPVEGIGAWDQPQHMHECLESKLASYPQSNSE